MLNPECITNYDNIYVVFYKIIRGVKVKTFDELPKSIKKSLRYINQDVKSLEKLEHIEKIFNLYIQKRKFQLKRNNFNKEFNHSRNGM